MSDTREAAPISASGRAKQRAILRSLAKRHERIVKLRAELQVQYDGRLEDWEQGRTIDPPILIRDLCSAAGVTEEAYRFTLRKAKEARERTNGA